MRTIEVFERALCCSTGVCGPDVPQELVTFSADVDWLRGLGADVARFNLAGEPEAFARRAPVRALLEVAGSDGLPLVLVEGSVAMAGRYPSRAELARWAGTEPEPAPEPERASLPVVGGGACCGGGGAC